MPLWSRFIWHCSTSWVREAEVNLGYGRQRGQRHDRELYSVSEVHIAPADKGPPTTWDGTLHMYVCQEMPSSNASGGGDKHVGARWFTSWTQFRTPADGVTQDRCLLQMSCSCNLGDRVAPRRSGNVLPNLRAAHGRAGGTVDRVGSTSSAAAATEHVCSISSDLLLHKLQGTEDINKS